MVERFGPGIVAADGSLDRAAVADRVFNDGEALADLNAIVHPAVGKEIADRMTALAETDEVVVLDVPLLVESKNAYPVAGLLVVDVDPEVAVRRLVEHRGMREEDVRARMTRQASREERLGPGRPGHRQQRHPRDLAARSTTPGAGSRRCEPGEGPNGEQPRKRPVGSWKATTSQPPEYVTRQGSTGTVSRSVPSPATNVTALGSSPSAITVM